MLRKAPRVAPYIGAIPQFLAATPTVALAETHPVIEELADAAKDAIHQQIRSALAGASRYFTARAEKTEDEQQRREFLDALHALRLATASLQRACTLELDRALAKPGADMQNATTMPISPICQNLWHGLREQLDSLCVKFSVTPFAPRLSPENLCAVIRHGVARAELSPRTIALTQELIEHGLLSHLDQVYRRVAERLEQYALPGAVIEFPVAMNQSSAPAPAAALHVDPHTKALLVEMAQAREPDHARKSSYSNAELAAELLETLKLERTSAVPVRARAVVQRLALVGRMFGAIGTDARLPEPFKRALEKLRFPIIKSALVDSKFFTEKSHSLRMMTADFVRKAVAHADSTSQLETLIANAAGDFDLSATFVRPALAGLRPLQAAQIEQFLADLQDAAADLTRLIDERERDRGRAEGFRERLAGLETAEINAPPVRIISIEPPSRPAAPAPVAIKPAPVMAQEPIDEPAPHLLETLFLSAVWFRVYDHKQRKPRWMRLESFYPEKDAVAFSEFDGANPLSMKATQFLDDLRTGRSAPTNPDDRVRRLLARLQKEHTAA